MMNSTILKVLNTSFISIIPKQDNARNLDLFILINLYNVVYKIISKVVANRLKPLLPTLVSVRQFVYVEGRQILSNTIQAHEVVHPLTSIRKYGMIMQLVVDKAYDKFNWTCIMSVVIAFGLDHKSVRWVMDLVGIFLQEASGRDIHSLLFSSSSLWKDLVSLSSMHVRSLFITMQKNLARSRVSNLLRMGKP